MVNEHGAVEHVIIDLLRQTEHQAHFKFAGQFLESPDDRMIDGDGHVVHSLLVDLTSNNFINDIAFKCTLWCHGNLCPSLSGLPKRSLHAPGISFQIELDRHK